VLDVGTGTGVLARIARARGAGFVAGTDIDPAALAVARGNARLDAAPAEILFADAPPDHWGPRFDLVVANILEAPLRSLAGPLARALAPRGILLLSGFTRLQVPALRAAYSALEGMSESFEQDWALLALRRA
jgi:ribosomal protein L11 methyltransferase